MQKVQTTKRGRGLDGPSRLVLRLVMVACAASVALGGCETGPSRNNYRSVIDAQASDAGEVETHFGNYLAARQATRERDTTAAAEFYDRTLKNDPNNLIIRERAFLLELTSGDFDRAVGHADLLTAERSRNRLARMTLATEALRAREYQSAREHMGESAKGLYNALAVDLLSAWSYAGDGDLAKAAQSLDELQAFGSGDLLAAYHMALLLEFAGKDNAANDKYLDALELSGGVNLRVVEAYGHFLERQGRRQEAIDLYTEFLEVAPDQIEITFALERSRAGKSVRPFIGSVEDGAAECYLSVAGFLNSDRTADLSIVYLRLALALREDLEVARAILGDIYMRQQQWSRAAETFAEIPVSDPLGTEAAIQIAGALQRMERPGAAIEVLEDLVGKKPNDFTARVSLADLYRTEEEFAASIEHYTAAFDLLATSQRDPNWFVHYARGISLHQVDRWEEAERDFLKALEISPDQPMVLNYLGYSWVERGYRVTDALALVEKAANIAPNNGFVVDSLGWAHYQLGNYEEAIMHLERAVELEPEDATLHDHLGDAYWKAGRYLEAGFEWSHALKLNPDDGMASAIEQKLAERARRIPNS